LIGFENFIMRAFVALFVVFLPTCVGAQELVLIDANDKEVRLKEWKIVHGTQKLPWTKDSDDFIEVREESSTTFQQGIQTFVPLSAVKRIDYDGAAKTATFVIRTAGGKEEKLTGTTKFQGINKLAVETEVNLGELGQATAVYLGGVERGLKSIQFPAAKGELAPPVGKAYAIVAHDKMKSAHAARALTPLYQVRQSAQLQPYLYFKPSAKVEFANIVSLKYIPSKDKKQPVVVEVATQDGNRANLQPLDLPKLNDQSAAGKLIGLAGRVPAGWKVFPLHTIQELKAAEK
jgi:hypothetical protein